MTSSTSIDGRAFRAEPFLAGLFGIALVGLGLAKVVSWSEVLKSTLAAYYVGVTVGEIVLGLALIATPQLGPRRIIWGMAVLFCGSLFLYSFVGEPIADCQCFGAFAEIGQVGRTVLAAVMTSIALLGFQATAKTSTES